MNGSSLKVKAKRIPTIGLATGMVDIKLSFQLKRGATFQDVMPVLTKILAERGMREMQRQRRGRDKGVMFQFGIGSGGPGGGVLYISNQIDATEFKSTRGRRGEALRTDLVEQKIRQAISSFISRRMAEGADDQSPPLEAYKKVGLIAGTGREDRRLNAFEQAESNYAQLVRELTETGQEARLVLRVILPSDRDADNLAETLPEGVTRNFYGEAAVKGLMVLRGLSPSDATYTNQLTNTMKVTQVAADMNLDGAAVGRSRSVGIKLGSRVSKVIPYSDDGGCFWYAMAAHKQYHTGGKIARRTYFRMRIGNGARQTYWTTVAREEARKFAARVRLSGKPMTTLDAWNINTDDLANYIEQLGVDLYIYHFMFKNLMFKVTREPSPLHTAQDVMVLLVKQDEENIVGHVCLYEPNPHLLFGKGKKWCRHCAQAYPRKNIHKCGPSQFVQGRLTTTPTPCLLCKRLHTVSPPSNGNEVRSHCSQCNILLPMSCLEEHKVYCNPRHTYCGDCQMRLTAATKLTHKCNAVFCRVCYKYEPLDHVCYVTSTKVKPMTTKVIVFDCECYLDPDEKEPEKTNHNVALIVARYLHQVEDYSTGDGEWQPDSGYYSFTDVHDFLNWLVRPIHQEYVVFAHNMSGYDGHLVLRGAHTHTPKLAVGDIIFNGNRVMHFKFTDYDITFGDSARLMPSTLANLPKMFGFQDMSKGHFPYKFCTTANKDYQGDMPEQRFYIDIEMQSPQEVLATSRWLYEETQRRRKQVAMPRHPRKVMFNLQDEMRRYCRQDVDILCEALRRFQHMFWNITKVDPLQKITIASTAMAVYRTSFMDHLPAHAFAQMGPLEQAYARKAYRGGMTEVMKLYCDFKKTNSEGSYADICSSYPNVMRNNYMPVGAPVWIEDPQLADLPNWFGMIECDVTPPDDMLLPILPERREVVVENQENGLQYVSSKLEFNLFPKTKTVWTSPELELAMEHGYKVTKVYSVLHWPRKSKELFANYVDTFILLKDIGSGPVPPDPNERVRKFRTKIREMKLAPEHYGTLCTQVRKMIAESAEHKDWDMRTVNRNDLAELATVLSAVKNPGLRAMSKLCLNSLYGKFGQQPLKHKTKAVYTYNDLHKVVSDPSNIVKDLVILTKGKGVGYVKYLPHANDLQYRATGISIPHIAAFVTAYARLDLWKRAYAAGFENVVYMDTDSVVARDDPVRLLPYENKLGGWEQENVSPITRVVALAPKTYCIQFADGTEDCHSKGWTHTQALTDMFDFDFFERTLRSTVVRGHDFPTVRFQNNGKHSIQTVMLNKQFRPVLSKRCLHKIIMRGEDLLEVTTIPHGHKECPHTRSGVVYASEIHTPFTVAEPVQLE